MMERVGYDLTTVAIPGGVPGYLRDAMIDAQKVMDDQYLHGPGGLDNFYGQADAWLQTQAIKRGSNRWYDPDPKFPMAIPRRLVVVVSESGLSFSEKALPPDPRIKMPALDPLPPDPPPSGPVFGGTHPPADPSQMLAAVLDAVRGMENRLTALINQRVGSVVSGSSLSLGNRQ